MDQAGLRYIKGIAYVLGATAIWSGNFIVARVLADSVPPVTLVVLRSVIACIILLPFVIRHLYRDFHLIRLNFFYIAVASFLGVTACNTLVYIAASETQALNMTLIAICSPIFTIIFARIILSEELTRKRVVGVIGAFTGVVYLITNGEASRLLSLTLSKGDLWMMLQAMSFAVYSIMVRKKPAAFHPLSFLFSLFFFGMLFLIPWFLTEIPVTYSNLMSSKVLIAVFYLGIGPSLLAYLFWNQSVDLLGPARASLVYYLLPLFSGIGALIYLGEPITNVHLISGILIFSAVIYATRG